MVTTWITSLKWILALTTMGCSAMRTNGTVYYLTADKDFGELVFMQGKPNTGIVLLRLAGVAPTKKAKIVSEVLAAHGDEMRRAFSVITDKMLRIRPNRAAS